MKKQIYVLFWIISIVFCSMPVHAEENPYGKYQTIDGITTIRCTYYAWQQAYDNTGVILPKFGHAKYWYSEAQKHGYSVGSEAKPNSIAVWSGGEYGHVSYVVSVNGNKMVVNEGGMLNAKGTAAYNGTGIATNSTVNSVVGKVKSKYSSKKLIGFIYLTENFGSSAIANTPTLTADQSKIKITETNAVIYGKVLKPSNSLVTKIGCMVWEENKDTSSAWEKYENPSKDYSGETYMVPYYNLNTELNITLNPGTTYCYRIYAVIDGNEYWSDVAFFTTSGSNRNNTIYTITYNANGGTGEPAAQTKKHGENINISNQMPTRDGYTFIGWSGSANGDIELLPGDTCTYNYNLTLYAVWKANLPEKPTINVLGTTFSENEEIYFSWNDVSYGDYYEFKVYKVDGNLHYVNWGVYDTEYSIALEPGEYIIYVVAINEDLISTGTYYTTSDKLYIKVDEIETYTLYYNSNGGIEPPTPKTVTSGTTVTVSSVEPTKPGYTFCGWSAYSYASVPEYTAGDSITIYSNKTLYAVWKKLETNNKIILIIGQTAANVFGQTIYNDVAPIIENNRTMLPARFVSENLGATVEWNGNAEKVTITKGVKKIEIYIGSHTAYINGTPSELDSPAFIRDGRTYTPVRFICENLGASVEWSQTEQKVTITKN